MLTRNNIAEERNLNVRKKQVYSKIGVFTTRKRFTRSSGLHPNILYTKKPNRKATIFSLEDGSTTYIRKNELMAQKTQQRLKYLDILISMLTMSNLIVWTLENESFYSQVNVLTSKINLLRMVYLIITVPIVYNVIILVALIYQRSKTYIECQKHRGERRVDVTLFEWEHFSLFLFEIFYNAIIVPIPGIDIALDINQRELDTEYSLDDFLYLVGFGKCYWLIRVFRHFSVFSDFKAYKTCQQYEKQADISFAVRAHIQKNPFLFESLLMVIVILVFCVPVRIFERVLQAGLHEFENDMWIMTLVFSTIGYGEMTPMTNLGRLTTATAAYIGVFLFSLLIVSMTNLLILEKGELQAFNYIEKSTKLRNYQAAASNFIKKFMQYIKERNRQKKQINATGDRKKTAGMEFLEVMLYKKKFESARIDLKESQEASDTIIDNIRDQASIEFGVIKTRISRLNLDKYQHLTYQCCGINEKAKDAFQKSQQSLNLSQDIARNLENLIIERSSEIESLKPHLQDSGKTVQELLKNIKNGCFEKKLISLKEIQGTEGSVLERYRTETENMLKKRRRNGHEIKVNPKEENATSPNQKVVSPKVMTSLANIVTSKDKMFEVKKD